ncbi:MAG: type II secretion system protein M [Gammaproteobacteria bacterium]|nr:type II secretion system protein M [Gammaproteobacteria bacterium]
MKQFIANLSDRERVLLAGGGGGALLVLLFLIAWHPFSRYVERLDDNVVAQRELRVWMQQAATEVKQLRGSAPARRGAGQSLLAVADSTARQHGLAAAMKRVEPEGTDKVRIRLEQAGFDDLTRWLELLVREHGVRIESITIDGRSQSGTVDARLALQAGTP